MQGKKKRRQIYSPLRIRNTLVANDVLIANILPGVCTKVVGMPFWKMLIRGSLRWISRPFMIRMPQDGLVDGQKKKKKDDHANDGANANDDDMEYSIMTWWADKKANTLMEVGGQKRKSIFIEIFQSDFFQKTSMRMFHVIVGILF